jgi:hypothetical protein
MKKTLSLVLTLLLVLFSGKVFAASADLLELENYYKEANDAISLEDFPDTAAEPLKCAYFWSGTWYMEPGVSSYTAISSEQGRPAGMGPLFPGEKGKEIKQKGLVFNQASGPSWDEQVTKSELDLKDSEIIWKFDNFTRHFRRKGAYIFYFARWTNGNTANGYCWHEKKTE